MSVDDSPRVTAPAPAVPEDPVPPPPREAADAASGAPDPTPIDPVGMLLRRIVARGRNELSRAAQSGRQRLRLHQLRRDLDHFWARLGKTAYHLVEAGELEHPALEKAMQRIDELEARIAELEREP